MANDIHHRRFALKPFISLLLAAVAPSPARMITLRKPAVRAEDAVWDKVEGKTNTDRASMAKTKAKRTEEEYQ
jgi:hypothetical protein